MGVKWGPFWWRYNLSFAGRFIEAATPDRELRWYGFTVGNVGVGVIVRVRRTEAA